jgi:hypothetical protein
VPAGLINSRADVRLLTEDELDTLKERLAEAAKGGPRGAGHREVARTRLTLPPHASLTVLSGPLGPQIVRKKSASDRR